MEPERPRRLDLPPGGRAWDESLILESAGGIRVRAALWHGTGRGDRPSRGHVLLLHGRTEFLEKYTVPAAELVVRGFAVASLDWRGQGRSDRLTANQLKGHVTRFTDYDRDLAALTEHPKVAALPGPRLVLAHSMGGVIALGATLRGVVTPAAMILCAPMLGLAMTPLQRALARVILPVAPALGRRESWPPLRGVARPYVFGGFEGNLLTGDRAAFEWMAEALRREPRFRIGMPTLGWLESTQAELEWLGRQGPLGVPGLCLLGSDEAVVDPAAVRAGAARLGLELVEVAGARHELLLAAEPARAETWAAIDRFLEEQGL